MKIFKLITTAYLLLLLLGCEKRISSDFPDRTIETLVQDLKTQNAIFNNSPQAGKLINNLNKKVNFSLATSNGLELVFIKINGTNNEYLSVFRSHEKVKTGGVFRFTSFDNNPKEVISAYYNQKRIDNGNKIEVLNIDGTLLSRIESLPGGHIKETTKERFKPIKEISNNGYVLSTEQDPYGGASVCTDWYLVSYLDGELVSEEYVGRTCEAGSTGGGTATYIEGSSAAADDGKLSCKSFSFTSITGNAYEAGVSGLQFSFTIYGTGITKTFSFRDVFVNFPKTIQSGTTYTAGDAAAYSAAAFNRAALSMALQYQFYTVSQAAALTTSGMETQFKNLVSIILSNEIGASAQAYFIQKGSSTITSPVQWNSGWDIIWNGLTGTGCKGQ